MNWLPIAASDMDVIIGIIAVVGWILAQVLGRKKGNSEPTPGEPLPPTDPQDELRKFFEQLEKSMKPQEEPRPATPPPVPAGPAPARTHAHPKRERPPPRVRSQMESEPAERVIPVPAVATYTQAVPEPEARRRMPVAATPSCGGVSSLMPDIQSPAALRKMIVSLEVLGKPVALRNGAPVL